MDAIEKKLLHEVADLDALPVGAYNIRENGKLGGRNTTANIDIQTKKDKPGIDIYIKPGTVNESVHIPVILSETGLYDMVYNDFYIGEGCDVVIVAGCGIHNGGCGTSQHDGIHTFYVAKGAHVKYIEKHYGEGEGSGKRLMNPTTVAHIAENGIMEMETTQISGIDDTLRCTKADLAAGAKLVIREKILTTGDQNAHTDFTVDLNGEGSSADVVSRSVAKNDSRQQFDSLINGNSACHGHTECDAIIMDNGRVLAKPCLAANNIDASLIHEAAIGKIAGEQLIKLYLEQLLILLVRGNGRENRPKSGTDDKAFYERFRRIYRQASSAAAEDQCFAEPELCDAIMYAALRARAGQSAALAMLAALDPEGK